MAKATANGVSLELTLEEAIVLRSLTGAVYGSVTTRQRKATDAIYAALRDAGVADDRNIDFSVSIPEGA